MSAAELVKQSVIVIFVIYLNLTTKIFLPEKLLRLIHNGPLRRWLKYRFVNNIEIQRTFRKNELCTRESISIRLVTFAIRIAAKVPLNEPVCDCTLHTAALKHTLSSLRESRQWAFANAPLNGI